MGRLRRNVCVCVYVCVCVLGGGEKLMGNVDRFTHEGKAAEGPRMTHEAAALVPLFKGWVERVFLSSIHTPCLLSWQNTHTHTHKKKKTHNTTTRHTTHTPHNTHTHTPQHTHTHTHTHPHTHTHTHRNTRCRHHSLSLSLSN